MTRREITLAALAAAECGSHTPVQVQKLFFLIEREVGAEVGGSHFNFAPYNYGPFDAAVYEEIEALARDGLVEIDSPHGWQEFRLSPEGYEQGRRLLESIPEPFRNYIRKASEFVRSLSFNDLVRAIYRQYPDMRANSVFRG